MEKLNTIRVVGIRSAYWYALYRIERLTGISRRRTPLGSWDETVRRMTSAALEWDPSGAPHFFFDDPRTLGAAIRDVAPDAEPGLAAELEHIQKGSYCLWEDTRHELGFPPDWNRNSLTGQSIAADRHWTDVNQQAAGDIKGIWELSRFNVAFRLARCYALTGDERAPEIFWQLVESWLAADPPNAGPQWVSSQEVALRAMAWVFALNAFARSPATTAVRKARIIAALGVHARRIEATLAYAKAQNNNHLISEAAGLFTIGLLFPKLPGSTRRLALGRALLELTTGQFFLDGGYIQHSVNYHRLALQLYAWAMRLAEINGQPFSRMMYSCVDRSLDLLGRLIDPATGCMPNFGHNDGALFSALNSCAYEDYRPLLQTLVIWRQGARFWTAGPWDGDAIWMLGPDAIDCTARLSPEELEQINQNLCAPHAGLFALHGRESHAVVRCAQFRERPAHADHLHVDLWWCGENIACDAGSYLYGGDPPWRNSLTHAALHNTVTIDGLDQMERAGQFGWATLAQGRGEFLGNAKWQGTHDGYRALGVTHRRTVEFLSGEIWIITDEISGSGRHSARLHWLIPDYPWEALAPEADPALEKMMRERLSGWEQKTSVGRKVRALAGDFSLRILSDRETLWNIYRAGEMVFGSREEKSPIPTEIRGWRSLRYASKLPALSIAGTAAGKLPIRFISIWSPLSRRK